MEALKVNKFGRTYHAETQAAQDIVVGRYYFINLYLNIQLVKRDIVTAVIYYITTEFHYAKCGSSYGGVVYGENVNRHFIRNFDTLETKINDLNSNTFICYKA